MTAPAAGGAAAAAQRAIADGNRLILGPLLAEDVRAAAPVARRADVPVVAFSNDEGVAGNGVYIMGFTPDQSIDRVVSLCPGERAAQFRRAGAERALRRSARRRRCSPRCASRAGGSPWSSHIDRSPAAVRAAAGRLKRQGQFRRRADRRCRPDGGARGAGAAARGRSSWAPNYGPATGRSGKTAGAARGMVCRRARRALQPAQRRAIARATARRPIGSPAWAMMRCCWRCAVRSDWPIGRAVPGARADRPRRLLGGRRQFPLRPRRHRRALARSAAGDRDGDDRRLARGARFLGGDFGEDRVEQQAAGRGRAQDRRRRARAGRGRPGDRPRRRRRGARRRGARQARPGRCLRRGAGP